MLASIILGHQHLNNIIDRVKDDVSPQVAGDIEESWLTASRDLELIGRSDAHVEGLALLLE